MSIFIQNSLTKQKEPFVPQVPTEVKMYTCGVTVYDDCHVGHARSLFIFSCIKKYLEYKGFSVKLVRNITDVDDKIINRAKQEGVEFEEIRKKYIDSYYRDLKSLEIDKADFEPLATENVFYMVDHIRQLITKGKAYEVDGDVYFSVRTFADYGKLSGQSIDEMLTAVRIEKDEKKRDPLDFALWKKSKEGEPSWKSPWGNGRPGWHIECSTMSMRYLRTQTLDIHAGGRDLIFPHHENEIAQAEALTGKSFAKYWIHHGLLTIDGRKMSKSLGNFVTITDVLTKHKPNALKLFFLSAHYGSPMDFTFDGIKRSEKALAKLEEFLDKTYLEAAREGISNYRLEPALKKDLDSKRESFERAMNDDFNTAQALAVLFDIVNFGNKLIDSKNNKAALCVADLLVELGGVLGLNLRAQGKHHNVNLTEQMKIGDSVSLNMERIKIVDSASLSLDSAEIQRLLEERRQARMNKDYKRADEIRAQLRRMGVVVEDKQKMG